MPAEDVLETCVWNLMREFVAGTGTEKAAECDSERTGTFLIANVFRHSMPSACVMW